MPPSRKRSQSDKNQADLHVDLPIRRQHGVRHASSGGPRSNRFLSLIDSSDSESVDSVAEEDGSEDGSHSSLDEPHVPKKTLIPKEISRIARNEWDKGISDAQVSLNDTNALLEKVQLDAVQQQDTTSTESKTQGKSEPSDQTLYRYLPESIRALREKDVKLHGEELKEFSNSFKISTPVPDDVLHIVANTVERREAIRRKSCIDSRSSHARRILSPEEVYESSKTRERSASQHGQSNPDADVTAHLPQLKLPVEVKRSILQGMQAIPGGKDERPALARPTIDLSEIVKSISREFQVTPLEVEQSEALHHTDKNDHPFFDLQRMEPSSSCSVKDDFNPFKSQWKPSSAHAIGPFWPYYGLSTTTIQPGVAANTLFDQLRCDSNAKVHLTQLRPHALSVIMNVLQFILDYQPVYHREAERLLRHAIDISGELPTCIVFGSEIVKQVTFNPLAGGGFADVYKGSMHEQDVSLKVPRVFDIDMKQNLLVKKECFKEVVTWLRLRHPNVLPFIGVNRTIFHPRLALMSPWMQNGSVLKYLKAFPMADRIAIIKGIATGLDYLHTLKPRVVHGDLRASNVLVDDYGCPGIADFGLVRIEDSLASVTGTSFSGSGSLRWQAPELICPDQFPDIPCKITTRSDVYAFACVCLEVFTSQPPFAQLREISVLNEVVLRDRRPSRPWDSQAWGLNDTMWNLMQWCWFRHPGSRPDMSPVVRHLDAAFPTIQRNVGTKNDTLMPKRFHLPDYHVIHEVRGDYEAIQGLDQPAQPRLTPL